jgi:hypothetical protein
MSVIARSKSSTRLLRRRREARPQTPVVSPRPAAGRAESRAAAIDVRERTRLAGRPQDESLYTCGCGFQFSAAVSASVDCPHCGDAQAW